MLKCKAACIFVAHFISRNLLSVQKCVFLKVSLKLSDPSPKVTIEHRPSSGGSSAPSNKQIKGASRSNTSVNKGKGPAKKFTNRPCPK